MATHGVPGVHVELSPEQFKHCFSPILKMVCECVRFAWPNVPWSSLIWFWFSLKSWSEFMSGRSFTGARRYGGAPHTPCAGFLHSFFCLPFLFSLFWCRHVLLRTPSQLAPNIQTSKHIKGILWETNWWRVSNEHLQEICYTLAQENTYFPVSRTLATASSGPTKN